MANVNESLQHSLASAIGKRVTIRLHDLESKGYRDIVGVLQSTSELKKSSGEIIQFLDSKIAIWREIKPLPDLAGKGAPQSLRILELEKISDATWNSDSVVEYGDWLLRISDGFTMRANSVLPIGKAPFGNPPTDIKAAVKHITELYRNNGLVPTFTLPLPIYQELDDYLSELGWQVKVTAKYLVKDIASTDLNFASKYDYQMSAKPGIEWLGLQNDFALEKIMNRYPAKYGALLLDSKVIAVARVATLKKWALVTRLYVSPEFRGQGVARQLMQQLFSTAANDGASKIGLQVDVENIAALALYESMGFRHHHKIIYRVLAE